MQGNSFAVGDQLAGDVRDGAYEYSAWEWEIVFTQRLRATAQQDPVQMYFTLTRADRHSDPGLMAYPRSGSNQTHKTLLPATCFLSDRA